MLLEKRKSERSDIFLIVEFKQSNNSTEYSVGVTNNFSIDGFCLDSQRFDFNEGETIECKLKHSDTRLSVSAVGEIIWRRDSWYNCTAGIKFKETEDKTKNRIAEFIAAVKDKHNGLSFIKDNDSLPAETDREKYSSQSTATDNGVLFKAFQAAEKKIPGADSESHTDAECEPCKAVDETKNNGKIREEAPVKGLASEEDSHIYHDKDEPSYNTHAHAGNVTGASGVKKKIFRLYVPIAAFIIIVAGVVFYIISGDERDNGIITAPANPEFIQHVYKDPESTSGNETQINTSSDQEVAETAQSQNTLIHENKDETSGPALDVLAKDITSDKSTAVTAGQAALQRKEINSDEPAVVMEGHAALQKLPGPEKLHETKELRIKGSNNKTRENPAPKILVPHVSSDVVKKNEPVVETRVQPVAVPALPHKDTIIHKDTFSDDTTDWDMFDTNMASAAIKNGEYLFENKRKKGPHIIFYPYDLPGDSSFVAEASIRAVTDSGDYSYGLVVRNPDNYSYGIVFGAKDTFNNYTFQIRRNGSYSIRKYENGSMQELADGKIKKTVYNQTGINVLKIVRKDGILQFYINDVMTAEIPDMPFFGNKAGLILDGELKIAVDNVYTEIQ